MTTNPKTCRLPGVCVLVALVALAGCDEREFAFVRAGRPTCSVVATGNKVVDGDIAFFTNAVARMTGAEVKVEKSDGGGEGNRLVFAIEKRALIDEDDWSLEFPDPKTMKITGSEASCRWALNRLVEDWGAVFCCPGPQGTHWPRTNTLACARLPRRGTAALRLSRDLYVENPAWMRALGCKSLGDVNFFNHSMHAILPTAKYGVEPWVSQVMPEVKGKRAKPRNHYSGWQPCWASEVGRTEAIRNICAYLRKHPGQRTYSLSVNDLEGYCECAKCREMNGGTFSKRCKYGSRHSCHSESYYRWVNAVAEGVRQEFPDVWFGVLAYCGTIDPPSYPLNDHVVPFLCCDTYQAQVPEIMADREKLFAAWSEKAGAFGLWDYAYGCRAYQAPRMYLKTMAKYFALKKKYPKLQAFFMEGDSFPGEGPKRYLYGKLVADPDCDAEAELARWYRACGGEAAAADLKAYYDLWERFYTEGDIKKTLWFTRGITGVYMDFEQLRYVFALKASELERADRLMARAVAAAEESGDADQRERMRQLAEWHALYRARLVTCGVGLADLEGKFATAADAARFFDKLPELCEVHRDVIRLTHKVVETRLKDPGCDWRQKGHCDGLLKNILPRAQLNIISLFNDALDHLDDPSVRAAIARASKDDRIDARLRADLAGLESSERLSNLLYPEGLSPEEDRRLWTLVDHGMVPTDAGTAENGTRRTKILNEKGGWPAAIRIVPQIDPKRDYLFRVRIVNTSKAPLRPRVLFNTADPVTYASVGSNGGIEKYPWVKPGETRTISLFVRPNSLSRTTPAGRLYVILNGLPKGQSVFIDSCEFKAL